MKSVLSTNTIKEAENFTINECGIDALVLMERAAVEVAFSVIKRTKDKDANILVVCGGGNNGADGLCVSRILLENGYKPHVYSKASKSDLHKRQFSSLRSIYKHFCNEAVENDIFVGNLDPNIKYDVIVDALYGIGINRPLSEEDAGIVDYINNSKSFIISVDMPSGLNSTDGRVMGKAVTADETVCLGYLKQGLFVNEGPDYTGTVSLKEIGIWHNDSISDYLMLEQDDIKALNFTRAKSAHKGTYGKTLVVVGSENIFGASFLSAKSAIYSGAGMVKVITHNNNRHTLEKEIPEALFSFYDDSVDTDSIKKDIIWSDTVVVGPGLGTDRTAEILLDLILYSDETENKILVIDADGINLLARDVKRLERLAELKRDKGVKCVITPHKGELGRLSRSIGYSGEDLCLKLHEDYGVVVIDKGAHTRSIGDRIYINATGNDGMATAGSGDVLSGILGGILYRLEKEPFDKACAVAVWLHGKSGDIYAEEFNTPSLTASAIMNAVAKSLDFLT